MGTAGKGKICSPPDKDGTLKIPGRLPPGKLASVQVSLLTSTKGQAPQMLREYLANLVVKEAR
jgi:hypothetical protein